VGGGGVPRVSRWFEGLARWAHGVGYRGLGDLGFEFRFHSFGV
jgi:hypothetical protein